MLQMDLLLEERSGMVCQGDLGIYFLPNDGCECFHTNQNQFQQAKKKKKKKKKKKVEEEEVGKAQQRE